MSAPTPSIAASLAGRYEILAEIARGSFGRIYKARRCATGQLVALKTLDEVEPEPGGARPRRIERFRREMTLYAELAHPNIVGLLDAGETEAGALYAVFEFVPGRTLREVLSEGPLSWRETCRLMGQVLDALACAHARDIVHRDLKPENVIVTHTGARRNAMVIDFGLGVFAGDHALAKSRITATQDMMGTPCYAAPEQLRGEAPSPLADLYSWGLIFLECVLGEPVITGASPQEVIHKQLGLEPIAVPASIRDRRLRRLLEATVAKQAEHRSARVDELLDALEQSGRAASTSVAGPADVEEAERRQVTVVCCGITFASLNGAALDVEEHDHLCRVEYAVLAELATRTGGVVTSALADRVMLVYGYPQAREDDARRACRAALQIAVQAQRWSRTQGDERGLRLDVRVGVHTGLVIARSSATELRDVVGVTPQVAARLKTLAGVGEVWASADTHRLLRDDVAAEPMGEHRIPELSRALGVVRLLGVRRTVTATVSHEREPPLVGRAEELALLTGVWTRAQAGASAAIVVSGEPGIGKSRLVRELRRLVPARSWLECRCMPENQHTPLRPISDLIASLDRSLEALLTRYGFDVAETLPLLATALSLPLDATVEAPALTPERQKELVLDTLLRLLFAVAHEHPVAFVVEDLHWADPTTLELLSLLMRESQVAGDRGADPTPAIATVCTTRGGFSVPAGGVSTVYLTGLARPDVETLVRALLDDAVVPREVIDQVVRHAEGVPLFVEEVARMLAESGPRDDDAFGIPSSLRDLLATRFDSLSPGARDLMQTAAVLGREFTDELLRTCAAKEETLVRAELRELADAGILLRRRSVRQSSWAFKHMLLRDAAYETMIRSTRRALHRRAAETLHSLFADVEAQRPELLAHHLELAGDPLGSADYWKAAGDRSMTRGAFVEAVQQFERGLAGLERLPENDARWRSELAIGESYALALLATRGYSAPEVETAYHRFVGVCDRLGQDAPTRVLYGLWSVRLTRADRDGTAELLPRWKRLADRQGDPVSMLTWHGTSGVVAFLDGDLVRARDEMRSSLRWYDTDGYREYVRQYGYDGGLYNFAYLAWSLQLLGEPDAARAMIEEVRSRAQANGSPYGIALALCFRALIARDQGDVATAIDVADRAIAQAMDQKLYYWLGSVTCLRGWAAIRDGDAAAGIAQVEHGLALFDLIGLRASYGYHLAALAEGHLASGAVEPGLAAVDRALELCATTLDRFYEPELLRLRGELLRRRGDLGGAEGWMRRSLELGAARQGRWFELRAATSLARLLHERDDRREAHGVLSTVYGTFREGFETGDLRAARELLAALG
jgi:TOMM system kinase/cyclase fusion protein